MQPDSSEFENSEALHKLQTLLEQTLRLHGITVTVAQENLALAYILLESESVPDPQKMLPLICQSVAQWVYSPPLTLRIYGRSQGDSFTAWVQEITLPAPGSTADGLNDLQRLFQTTSFGRQGECVSDNSASDRRRDDRSQAQPSTRIDQFIVCGLGRLGQHCAMSLKFFAQENFGIQIVAIDRQPPSDWEVDHLSDLLDEVITGDCRQDRILNQAGIKQCRAILIVTQDENVNIETAIAARRLNPDVRLIVRSGKENLTELLKEKLGNFAAFEPIELPAESFVLAALGEERLGMFKVGDSQLQVVKHQVKPGDYRFENMPVHKLYKETCRLLSYHPMGHPVAPQISTHQPSHQGHGDLKQETLPLETPKSPEHLFYQWHPDARVCPGDTLFYIEAVDQWVATPSAKPEGPTWLGLWQNLKRLTQDWRQMSTRLWTWMNAERIRQVTSLGVFVAALLSLLGAVLFKLTIANMTWQSAISSTVILLLGGYGDVFGGLEPDISIPWWVQVISFLITATSLLFVLSVLGLLADRLLTTRFDFLNRRPPVPQADHIVLVGLGRVGQRMASLLYQFRQPFVCLTPVKDQQDFMPQVPLVCRPILKGLADVNVAQARSLIVATDDQVLNLEVALTARNAASQVDRTLNLVIRAQDQRFCDHLNGLMPEVKALCVYALTAEAFAGAAFGENILSLFRMNHETILVTEYCIEASDTLHGKLLAQVAYGYGVVPIAYQPGSKGPFKIMPSDDVRLDVDDRLVVLATMNGLQRVEWGTLTPPRRWQLQALKPLDLRVTHYAGNTLENISGCSLSEARLFMDHLPQALNVPGVMELFLYDHQADHLLRKLRKLLPIQLTPLE